MKNIHKQSSLFILELFISIIFFILASLVCVQILVKSHEISNNTKASTIAMNYCIGYVEEFENNPSLYNTYKKYINYYNQNWKKCSKKKAVYKISIYCTTESSFETIHVKAYYHNKKIYSLKHDIYVKEEVYES